MRSIALVVALIALLIASGRCSPDGCVFPNNPCEHGSRCVFHSSPYGKCVPEHTDGEQYKEENSLANAHPVNDVQYEEIVDREVQQDQDLAESVGTTPGDKVQASSTTAKALTTCQQQQKQDIANCGGRIGCYITQCSEGGEYSPLQCHASTGYCWCVDQAGKKLLGTEKAPGSKPPVCVSQRDGAREEVSAAENMKNLEADVNAESVQRRRSSNADDVVDSSVQSTTRSSKKVVDDKSPVKNTSPSLIFLWVVIGCGTVLAVSIPTACVCAYLRYQRIKKEKVSMRTTIYPGHGTAPADLESSEREAILQTYRRQRLQREPSDVLSEPSVVRQQSTSSQEPPQGHMDIYTGHRVLSYLDDHIEHPDRLSKEWQGLVGYEAESESRTDSQEDINRGKNRYPDILPYNSNRVLLDSAVNPSRSDYINASFICDRSRQPSYIATQGPLETTVSDFWQMVWEQGCSVIVNLTEVVDQGIPQCHQYWPSNGRATYHMYELDFVSSHPVSSHYTIRSFFLKNLKTEATRTVTQCHFHSWPSLSVPEHTQPLLEFRRKVKKTYSDASKPVLIHDSAGVGRTGTYILIDMVLNRLSSASVREIDISATVEHLRDQRMQMVKTEAQFKFAFRALVDEVRAILDAMPGQRKQ